MIQNFYDKVAKKFGIYHTGAKYSKEYLAGDPEEIFKKNLLELSGKAKITLDVGCADGRFTLSIAPYFKKVFAIDMSKGMLGAARKLQKEKGVLNVSFEEQNANKTTYTNDMFDLVYSRRGPTPFSEFHRLLKSGSYFIEITIGEKDCQEIKEIFGRGQGFGEWNSSRLDEDRQKLKDNKFEITFAQNYLYDEYYSSYEDLDLFLQGVPIFEDFDSKKDSELLREYISQYQEKKGIRFPRHRVVIVAKRI